MDDVTSSEAFVSREKLVENSHLQLLSDQPNIPRHTNFSPLEIYSPLLTSVCSVFDQASGGIGRRSAWKGSWRV